jgi:serine/threonine protein phosphatase PrpC
VVEYLRVFRHVGFFFGCGGMQNSQTPMAKLMMNECAQAVNTPLQDPRDMDTAKLPGDCNPLAVRSYGLTDRGKLRETNQDHFLIATLMKSLQVQQTSLPVPKVQHSSDRSHLFLVADGMGGQAGGAQASALVIDSVESFILQTFKWFSQCTGQEQDHVLADFQSALSQANARVFAEAAEHPELRGMGTTLTLAYSLNDELFVAHVGDSRCYLYRNHVLCRLTRDHTLVEDMVRQGTLAAEDVATHDWRHVITNAVGGNAAEVKVEIHKLQLEAGDAVLLCSDGLTNMVQDEEIARILQAEADPEHACLQLVARGNEEGGNDNITVILSCYEAVG